MGSNFPKPEKSYLIVKDDHLLKVNDIFKHSNVKITSTGQRHLGAVIGSLNYKNKFINEKINSMVNQLSLLSKIAEIEPQAAYIVCICCWIQKQILNYLLRTIPDISINLHPFEEIIRNEFIPAITGGYSCSEVERQLLSLPTRLGGLAINQFVIECEIIRNTKKYERIRKLAYHYKGLTKAI